jgi:signal transduction histidine kinase
VAPTPHAARNAVPAPAPAAPLVTEAVRPERRRFILALGVLNALFSAIDVASGGVGPVQLAAAAALGVALLAAPVLLARARGAAQARWVVTVTGVVSSAAFGVVAATTPRWAAYLPLLPMLPLIFVVAVPDEPVAALLCGMVAAGAGLPLARGSGPTSDLVFWTAAFGTTTLYAMVGAGLYRRMRERERAAADARAGALEELARSERERAHAERLALVGRLAAGVAHEVGNPLSYAKANLGVVRERMAEDPRLLADPDLRESLEDACDALERIARLTSDLRGFSRKAPDRVDLVEVGEVAREAVRLASVRLRNVATPEVRVPDGLPRVLVSRDRLVQVLVNLLVNAADALQLERSSRHATELRVMVDAGREDGQLWLAVEDNGPGLRGDALERLFEPFFTTKGEAGTGLGLALSREFVERWGGSISAEEARGGGARFVIRLPLADQDGSAAP